MSLPFGITALTRVSYYDKKLGNREKKMVNSRPKRPYLFRFHPSLEQRNHLKGKTRILTLMNLYRHRSFIWVEVSVFETALV